MKSNSQKTNKKDVTARREFGLRLVTARQEKGMSQIELAKQVKSTSQTLSNIEHGYYWPRLHLYVAICRALGVKSMPLF